MTAARWQSKHTTQHTHIFTYLVFLSFSFSPSVCLSACLPACQYVRIWMNIKQIINLKCQKLKYKKKNYRELSLLLYSIEHCLFVSDFFIYLFAFVFIIFSSWNVGSQFNVLSVQKKFHNKNTAIFSHPFAVSFTLMIFSVCVCCCCSRFFWTMKIRISIRMAIGKQQKWLNWIKTK